MCFLWLGYSFATDGEEVEGVGGTYSGALLQTGACGGGVVYGGVDFWI